MACVIKPRIIRGIQNIISWFNRACPVEIIPITASLARRPIIIPTVRPTIKRKSNDEKNFIKTPFKNI
jgi:hypothetical protein